jgi:hypothetical protein
MASRQAELSMLRKRSKIPFKRCNKSYTQKQAAMENNADSFDLLTDNTKASDIEEKART